MAGTNSTRISSVDSLRVCSGAVTAAALAVILIGIQASARESRDFHHSSWTSENGLGAVKYLHQTADGYVWLTTTKGVFRFDGVRFQSIDEASHGVVRNKEIDSAFPAKSGGLWLSTQRQGMLRWQGEALKAFPDRRCTPSRGDGRIVEAPDGSLWIRSSAGLGHLKDGTCRMIGPEDGYPGALLPMYWSIAAGLSGSRCHRDSSSIVHLGGRSLRSVRPE